MFLAAAVTFSLFGMGFHTVGEFGWSGLLLLETGFIPVVGLQLALLEAGWLLPRMRGPLGIALAAIAVLHLVGGALITVLPLPMLPFVPEQSMGHYVSHLVYGAAQLPLIAYLTRLRGRLLSTS